MAIKYTRLAISETTKEHFKRCEDKIRLDFPHLEKIRLTDDFIVLMMSKSFLEAVMINNDLMPLFLRCKKEFKEYNESKDSTNHEILRNIFSYYINH